MAKPISQLIISGRGYKKRDMTGQKKWRSTPVKTEIDAIIKDSMIFSNSRHQGNFVPFFPIGENSLQIVYRKPINDRHFQKR